MSKYFLFITLLFCVLVSTYSQTPNKYGIKGGVVFTGIINSGNDNNLFFEPYIVSDYVNFSAGIYKEWFNTRKFCLSTELIYSIKGDHDDTLKYYEPVQTIHGTMYEMNYVSNRYQYLSLLFLPRYKFAITPSGENMFICGGPGAELLIGSYFSGDNENVHKLEKYSASFIAAAGFGVELMDFLFLEFRVTHSFSGPYKLKFINQTVSRSYTSASFYTGVSFNNFFKKNRKK